MKFRFTVLAITALIASTISFANTIKNSSNVSILALDGQKINKSFLKSQNNIELSNNQTHQFVVRVTEVIKNGSDRTLYESAPIIVTFKNTDEDLLISAPKLDNKYDVNKFEKNPIITLTTNSGNKLETKQEILKQEGFLPGLNIIKDLSNYNSSNSVASVSSFAIDSATPPTTSNFTGAKKGKVTVQGENIAEQQLQYWFQQADKSTQKRFMKWVQQQK